MLIRDIENAKVIQTSILPNLGLFTIKLRERFSMRLGILTTSRVRRGRLTKLMPRMHRGIRMTITVLMWCSVIDKKLSNSLSSRFHLLSQNLLLLPILIHDLCIQLVRTNGVVTLE